MRSRALPLAVCASLAIVPGLSWGATAASASDVTVEAPIDETEYDYDYGDDDYTPLSPIYYAFRGAATASDVSDLDVGVRVSMAAGVDMEQMANVTLTRFEVEVEYFRHDVSAGDGEVSGITGYVSLYRDLGEFYSLRPYIGAGVGFSSVSYEASPTFQNDDSGVAWHLTAGLSMDWSERTTLDFGYRYTGIEGVEVMPAGGAEDTLDLGAHALYAGLRFRL